MYYQVKHFNCIYDKDFEELNKFLKEKKENVINIKTSASATNGEWAYDILVIYKVDYKNNKIENNNNNKEINKRVLKETIMNIKEFTEEDMKNAIETTYEEKRN